MVLLALIVFSPNKTFAGQLTLAWDASPDAVAGYTVYYGTASGIYTGSVNTTETTLTIDKLTNGVRYFLIVKAFSAAGVYSVGSNEVNGIPANRTPSITNPGAQTTPAGSFSLTITASDPDGDLLTFSATGLPAGVTIDPATGRISGTASVAGTSTVTVTASDGALEASATFTLTVTAGNRTPTLEAPADQTHDLDDIVRLPLAASDPDGDSLTYSATGLPPGLSITSTTGLITGTPTIAATYAVTVSVSDGSLSASRSLTWTVVAGPPAVPISRWRFDEGSGTSAADSNGSRTGTLTNGATWTPGRFANAVLLDGTNDYVAVPPFDVTGSALTIAAWVRTSSFGTGEQRFISKTTGTTNYWALGTNGSALRFRLRAGGVNATVTAASTLPANTWYHAAATYDGTTIRLYVNGVQVISTAQSGAVATGTSVPVAIGRNPSGTGSNYFNGAIDDMRVFARGLTAAEILLLYTELAPPPPPPPPTPFTDDPLVPGVHTMRLVHITELRTRIDAVRVRRGLGPASWTPLVAGSTMIRASHITEMRTALGAVYVVANGGAPAYTDPALTAGMSIKAVHIAELRAAVRALE